VHQQEINKNPRSSRGSTKKISVSSSSESSSESTSSEESSESGSSSSKSVKSPYAQKIPTVKAPPAPATIPAPAVAAAPEVPEKIETPEERRARARTAFAELEVLRDRHGVNLSRQFSVFDDPDLLEEELKMQRDIRNKIVQVRFYKQILLNVVSGIEFLNTKYDPFDFKLQDWSKQVQ